MRFILSGLALMVGAAAAHVPTPAWSGYFADPFVLKVGKTYYAYGTGGELLQPDGRVFPILRSTDLKNWTPVGGAMQPLPAAQGKAYWAPEVAQRDGKFFMYYSAAGEDESKHRLRLATAAKPEGPFVDQGAVKMPEDGFNIDAHPFRDPKDGKWYLFYAKDFFDGRVGTGAAVVRLNDDMKSTTGPSATVMRATADWQIYALNRTHYGKKWDKWHTVEGPFVVPHGGKYYCFWSGGPWNTSRYGVGYGVADKPMGPYVEAGDHTGPTVLKEIPGKVLGPGHNSVVKGLDDKTDMIVFHGWDPGHTARRMFVEPLAWTAAGPRLAEAP